MEDQTIVLRKEAEKELKKQIKLETTLAELEQQLQENPQFIEFLKLQDKLNKQRQDFNNNLKAKMIEAGVGEIPVTGGRFVNTARHTLEIGDITKINKTLVEEVTSYKLKKEKVKAIAELQDGVLPEGVVDKVSYAFSFKADKEAK